MNAALVKLDVAAAALGWSAVKLLSLADEGTLLEPGFVWVWNLANDLDGERRDLRWWAVEVQVRAGISQPGPGSGDRSQGPLARVIGQILPLKRTNFHAGEVDAMFQIRHRTRLDYGIELNGGLVNGRTLYPRETLVAFLERRWIHRPICISPRATGDSRPDTNKSSRKAIHAGTSLQTA